MKKMLTSCQQRTTIQVLTERPRAQAQVSRLSYAFRMVAGKCQTATLARLRCAAHADLPLARYAEGAA